MENIDLLGFFTIGISGGFGHCIGMCHPFVLYISGRFVGEKRGYSGLFIPHLKYNLGRCVTYSLLGAFAGFLGGMVTAAGSMIGIQKISAVIAGAFLILYALLSFGGLNIITRLENKTAAEKITSLIKRVQPKGAFTTGLILGLLPCGLVYGALIGSTSSGGWLKGAMSMLTFGLGTTAGMMTAAVFGNFIMSRRGIFNKLSLILLLVMGCWFIWQGIRF